MHSQTETPESGPLRGACLCGAVRFEIEPPVTYSGHCHCSMCRRAHGAAFVTWTGVPTERFRITAGEDRVTFYRSSPEARRGFCSMCGSTMFFESTRWPGAMHVTVANLIDPLGRQPDAHVYFDDRAEWVFISDDLARFGGETGLEPL